MIKKLRIDYKKNQAYHCGDNFWCQHHFYEAHKEVTENRSLTEPCENFS